jgi:hypothetical protein
MEIKDLNPEEELNKCLAYLSKDFERKFGVKLNSVIENAN